ARRHCEDLGIDDFTRVHSQGRADRGNATSSESNISDGTLAAAAVDEKTAVDHDIPSHGGLRSCHAARLCGRGDADRSGAVERLVAADCHAVAIALVGKVVPQRMMLDAPVVPKGDGVRLPLEAAGQLRRLDVLIKHLQYCGAFVAL